MMEARQTGCQCCFNVLRMGTYQLKQEDFACCWEVHVICVTVWPMQLSPGGSVVAVTTVFLWARSATFSTINAVLLCYCCCAVKISVEIITSLLSLCWLILILIDRLWWLLCWHLDVFVVPCARECCTWFISTGVWCRWHAIRSSALRTCQRSCWVHNTKIIVKDLQCANNLQQKCDEILLWEAPARIILITAMAQIDWRCLASLLKANYTGCWTHRLSKSH